jgi:hypothetical protein
MYLFLNCIISFMSDRVCISVIFELASPSPCRLPPSPSPNRRRSGWKTVRREREALACTMWCFKQCMFKVTKNYYISLTDFEFLFVCFIQNLLCAISLRRIKEMDRWNQEHGWTPLQNCFDMLYWSFCRGEWILWLDVTWKEKQIAGIQWQGFNFD